MLKLMLLAKVCYRTVEFTRSATRANLLHCSRKRFLSQDATGAIFSKHGSTNPCNHGGNLRFEVWFLGDDEPAVLITTSDFNPKWDNSPSLYVPIYDDTSVLIDTDEYNVVPVDITPFNGYKELYDIPYFNGINSSSPPFQLSDVGAKGVLAISNHVLPDHPSKIKINPPNWHKGTSVYGGVVLHQDSSGKFEYVLLANSTANPETYLLKSRA